MDGAQPGRRARSGQVSNCEARTVGKAARPSYDHHFKLFQEWVVEEKEVLTIHNAEILLLDYGDVLLDMKKPMHLFEKIVAATVANIAGLSRKKMTRITKALSGFRKAHPPRSRPPIPDELAAAISAVQMAKGHRTSALLTWVGQRCYFRPGERLKIQVQDLLPPAGGAGLGRQQWSIQVAPEDRLEPSKTQTFDDTIMVDESPRLGALLGRMASGKAPTAPLFDLAPGLVRQQWSEACSLLGFPELVSYQLRHGGASSDLLARKRAMGEVMSRMRVRTLITLRRYAKPGRITLMLQRMSPAVRAFANTALASIDEVLEGNLVLPLPL